MKNNKDVLKDIVAIFLFPIIFVFALVYSGLLIILEKLGVEV